MLKKVLIILVIFTLTSCAYDSMFVKKVPKYLIEGITICYPQENTEKKINLNGFYSFKSKTKLFYSSQSKLKFRYVDSYLNVIFYKNGLLKYNFFPHFSSETENYFDKMEEYFKLVSEKGKEQQIFLSGGYWGIYKIQSDTLKIQCFSRATKKLVAVWEAKEILYKIVDENTLISIGRKPIIREKEKEHHSKCVCPKIKKISDTLNYFLMDSRKRTRTPNILTQNIIDTLKFIPTSVLPPSDCWLKKEKWFWCNEEDWMNYISTDNQ